MTLRHKTEHEIKKKKQPQNQQPPPSPQTATEY